MKTLEEFIYPTQAELFNTLRNEFRGAAFAKDKFILVRGSAPVLLVAHLDTVHAEPVQIICKSDNGNILMSPQGIGGDDRCGVYALAKIHELSEVKPYLLFTCDEEIGGIGAEWFCRAHNGKRLPPELDTLKFIIEIDRRGSNDAVFYDCHNPDFEEYILSSGFELAHGSFSDISFIAPELGVAAVNLSSGYYNPHTLHEYINRAELEHTIQRVIQIIKELDGLPRFEYATADLPDDDFDYYSDDDYFRFLK